MDHPFHHAPISIPPLLPYAFASNFHSFGANSSANDMATDPFMDCRIWSRLPQRLIDRIIACLPPPAMFRARAVCKRWYALIFSSAFLELYLQASPRHHWFLFFKQQRLNHNHIYRSSSSSDVNNNNNRRSTTTTADHHHHRKSATTNNYEIFLFDPENLKWYRLNPFPMIPPGFSPASSSGGLICWVSEGSGTKSIVLSNPLTGSLIQLPSTLRPRLCPSLGLTITNTSIDVVLAGDDLISPYAVKNLTSESFHIHGNGFYSIWGTTASLPRLCSFESGRMVHVEANGSKFYCMNYSPFSVLSYDVATNQWSKIQAPMRRFLRSPSLVESRGRLVLVAAVEKSKLNVPRSLRLWALQDCGTTWAEMERMPQQLYAQFAEIEGGRGFECMAHGEYVVMLVKWSVEALLFDFCRKRWVWIPSCPYVLSRGCSGGSSSCGEDDDGDRELHGFAYEAKVAVPITGLLEQLAVPFMNSFTTA